MKIQLFRIKSMSPSTIGNGHVDSVVLFVHGLGGTYWTWNKFSHHLKRHWKEIDSFGLEYDEYYGSQSLFDKIPYLRILKQIHRIVVGPPIELLSRHLETVVTEVCEEYENVIVVAHSMGGLVARKYIVNLLEDTKSIGKIKALITYATPHQGSTWANRYLVIYYSFLKWFLPKSEQVDQLSKTGEFINSLNKSWRDFNLDTKLDFYRVIGLEDWVVDPVSSSHLFDANVKTIANKGHFNIIKPHRVKDTAFMVTYNYLKKFKGVLELRKESEDQLDAVSGES
jgi:pimeloyl-ACP methyl ester carboxylesterase